MSYFGSDFSDLIQNFIDSQPSPVYLVTKSNGAYDDTGTYVSGADTRTEIEAAVVPLPDKKIYESGGHLTSHDRQMYSVSVVEAPLSDCFIEYKGRRYSIEAGADYSDFADGIGIYDLKHVPQLSGKPEGGTAP